MGGGVGNSLLQSPVEQAKSAMVQVIKGKRIVLKKSL